MLGHFTMYHKLQDLQHFMFEQINSHILVSVTLCSTTDIMVLLSTKCNTKVFKTKILNLEKE